MKITPLLEKAIRFATRIHMGQTRKGKNIPYIQHPLAVAEILSQHTDNENIIVAGMLHDTIEDCKPYGSLTRTMLSDEFNADVARMVNDLTEQDKTLSWAVRKKAALEHIPSMPHDSLLVKSADVLNNLSELNADIEKDGEAVFSKFNASKDLTIHRYNLLIPALKKAWSRNPLVKDLEYELERLNRNS